MSIGILASSFTAATAGFSPSDISGMSAWFKAADITGYSNGDTVSTWPAAVGTDGGAAGTPEYQGAGGPSSTPTVVYSGGDYHDCGSGYGTGSTTLFAVVKRTGTGTQSIVGHTASAGAFQLRYYSSAAQILKSQTAGLPLSKTSFPSGTFTVVCARYDTSTNQVVYGWDGTLETVSSTFGVTFNSDMDIGNSGGGEYWEGSISQIIRYDAALSNTDCVDVMDWLGSNPAG